jgi:hypothetical protein
MEHVTNPEQFVFLGIGFLVACVVIGLWMYFGVRGQPVDDRSTGELIRSATHNALHWRPTNMSSGGEEAGDDANKDRQNSRISSNETNSEIDETPRVDAETQNELITFGENLAIARLVASGAIGLTEGVKTGAGAKSGEKYQKRTRQIKAEVEKLKEPEFPALAASKRPSIVENT